MNSSRRSFMGGMLPSAFFYMIARSFAQSQSLPPGSPFPKTTQGDETTTPDPHAVLKSYQKDIKRDVGRLLELAQDLKKEVDKTDSSAVLNLSLLHKAEEIEKLAHQIRTMAHG